MSGEILADAWNMPFANMVCWYAKRLIQKKFHAVRVLAGNRPAFDELAREPNASMLIMNHCSWWDPMLMFALRHLYFKNRTNITPMDRTQLERFQFLRKCGLFGIDPDRTESLTQMTEYVQKRISELPRLMISLTPQGRFVDVRNEVRPRPGASAILARNPDMRVWRISCEYGFWQDQRPEIFLSVAEIAPPEKRSTASWQRQLGEVMECNQRLLADAVKSRDPNLFESILGDRGNKINPLYDLWLKARGKNPGIEMKHRIAPVNPRR
ncbi:MAG: hypothetical protein EXS12_01145 [Phycisphaerales bacterium]|nr:hypothetical protein [Phycisphaerales bacterium]